MPTHRKFVFANDQIYHVFNRGVEKRPTFTDKRDLTKAIQTLKFYQYPNLKLSLSKFLRLTDQEKEKFLTKLNGTSRQVEIIAYCLMPNHFHFLLKQKLENGISNFLANFQNSYTRFFNTKNDRVGPLFQGTFKAVLVEDDNQLIHLSRYIHLNSVSSFLIKPEQLKNYEWSSYPEYLNLSEENITEKQIVLGLFPSISKYGEFVQDQIDYARKLGVIKHLILD